MESDREKERKAETEIMRIKNTYNKRSEIVAQREQGAMSRPR